MKFIDPTIAYRLELAQAGRAMDYAHSYQSLHPHAGLQIEPVSGGYAIYGGQGTPVNRVIGLGLQSPVTVEDFEKLESFYSRFQAPCYIDLCPLADPSLIELLGKCNYRIDHFYNVFVCSLPEDVRSIPLSGDVRVTPAHAEEAELWLQTTARGFDAQEIPSQDTLDVIAPNFFSANAYPFFARIAGQPAGGGSMFIHAGVAEMGGASTRLPFRKQGVQTALLLKRLEAAQGQGCDLAMILTTPGADSQRNAEWVGFRLAYTKMVMVKNKPPER